MQKQKFDTIVKNLAAKNVNNKITSFIQELKSSFKRLGFDYADNLMDCLVPTDIKKFFSQVAETENFKKAFPAYLWIREEEKVAKDILNQLNIVQQALSAPDASENDMYKKP